MTRYAGDPVRALDYPPSVQDWDSTTISNISSGTFAAGTPTVEVDFVAPSSGRVTVTVSGYLRDSAGSNRVFLAPRITNNTGTPAFVDGPNRGRFSTCNMLPGVHYGYSSRTILVDNLVPGGSYNAQVRYAVDGGSTCDIAHRQITVVPVF